MAETIRGINVVIGADTTKLGKALEDVNRKSRNIQSELRQVERLLKFDPKNTTLLAQKQKLLSQAIENTNEKLNRLKSVQQQVNEQFQRGEISEEQYRAFQREVVKTEQELKKLEERLKSMEPAVKPLGERMQEVGDKFKKVGKRMTDIGKNLSTKVTAPLAGLGAVIAKTGMDFEAAMSEVAAISGATGDDLAALEAKAKEMGATTKFSASEAAEALKYMAMAGWDTQKMLDGLPGVMSLAAASGEDLATVSDIVTDAMTAFGLEASKAGHFADILAAASSNANTNVGMMGETFKYVAPVFGSLGYTAEDAALAIGLMANAGIKASQAGTALRGAITRMVKPTGDAAKLMEQLGIKLTDTQGNMLPFRDVMDQLRASFSKLTAEQQAQYASTIFGQEAMSGMLAIINASDEDYQKLAAAIDNSTGAAERMAKQMQDNLKGRLTELRSAIEGVALQLYEHMEPALKSIVAAVKQVVDWFAKLPPGAQRVIVIIAALAAAIGPLLLVLGMLVASLGSIMSFIGTFGPAIAGVAGPVSIAIAAIAGLVAAIVLAWNKSEAFRDAVTSVFKSISNVVSSAVGAVRDFIVQKFSEIQSFWKQNGKQIAQATTNVFNTIKSIISFVMPFVLDIIKSVWNNIKGVISSAIKVILGLIKTFSALLTGDWKGVWQGIKQILSGAIQFIWNAIQLGFMGKALGVIRNFVSGAIGRVTDLASKFKGKFSEILSAATSKFNSIKEKITSPIRSATDFVKGQVDKIVGFFRNMKISFPKIKLPHFKLSGKFSLNPPSVPKISVDWYKVGGVFERPVIFGNAGFGDVSEAIVPFEGRHARRIAGLIGKEMMREFQNMFSQAQPQPTGPIIIQIPINGRVAAQAMFKDIQDLINFENSRRNRFSRKV